MAEGTGVVEHERGLLVLNDLKRSMASMVSEFVRTLEDGKVSALEGFSLFMSSSNAARAMIQLLSSESPEVRKDVVWLMQHAEFYVPEGMTGGFPFANAESMMQSKPNTSLQREVKPKSPPDKK